MDFFPLFNSMRVASISTFITFFAGIFAAYYIAKTPRAVKGALDCILTLPLVLPPTVAGFFLLYLFGVKRPIGSLLVSFFGVKVPFSWGATVIAAVVISFPLMYRSARGAFEQVDENLLNAGRTLGMSEWSIFRKVVLPCAMPGVLSGGVLAFARGLGEFGATTMIAGNIAGKTRTLPLAVYSAVAAGDMQQAFQYVLILVVLSFMIVAAMNYFGMKGKSR